MEKFQYYIDDTSDITFGVEASHREKDSHGTVEGMTQALTDPTSQAGRDYSRKYDVDLLKLFLTYGKDFGNNSNLLVNMYQYGDDTQFVSAPQKYSATGAVVTPMMRIQPSTIIIKYNEDSKVNTVITERT